MPTAPILIKSPLVFTPKGLVKQDVFIKEGCITSVPALLPEDTTIIQGENYILSPGFIDLHVHLREPGFSYKETISTGTKAGAKGGFTTLCTMPNLSPVPDNMENLALQLSFIKEQALIDVIPYGAITQEEKGETLAPIQGLAPYVAGFSDDGKGVQSKKITLAAMKEIQKVGLFMAAHCEDEECLPKGGCVHEGIISKKYNVVGIPSISEWRMVERDIALVEETNCSYHVCHISAKESVDLVRKAKAKGLPVTCECTPHQLALCEEDIEENHGRFKMNPPLRKKEDQQAIIQGLLDGTIDCIATDHAPHSIEEKSKGLANSAFGVVGLETAFSVCYTALVQKGLCTLEFLLEKFTFAPAKILQKNIELLPGSKANFTLIDLAPTWKILPENFKTKGRSSPFENMDVQGEIVATYYKGKPVYTKGEKL